MNALDLFKHEMFIQLTQSLVALIPPSTLGISFEVDLKNQHVDIYFAFRSKDAFLEELVDDILGEFDAFTIEAASIGDQYVVLSPSTKAHVWIGLDWNDWEGCNKTVVYETLASKYLQQLDLDQ